RRARAAGQHVERIGAGDEPDDPQHHDDADDPADAAARPPRRDADPTAATERVGTESTPEPAATGACAPAVLDVAAALAALPLHLHSPRCRMHTRPAVAPQI